jgi:O-antigen/teichoic acid export membrane protein
MFKAAKKDLLETFSSIKEKGFFHLFTASIFIKVLAFGSQFFVAWWLTVEQIGEIKIIQTYFSLFTVIVLFGFNTSILKLCSENRELEQIVGLFDAGKKYVKIVFLISIPIIISITLLGLISPNERIQYYFLLVLIGLYPTVINECDTIYIQARRQIKLMSIRQIVVRSISLLLIILLTYLFGFDGYIIAYILSSFIAFISFRYIIRKLNINIIPAKVESPFRVHWQYSKFAFLALVIGQLGSYADVFLMNYYISNNELIGLYSFALLLMLMPNIFTGVIQQIVVPYISRKSHNLSEIKRVYKKYQRLNILSSLIIAIGCLLVVPFIIDLIFGSKYSESIPFFNILIVAWFLNSVLNLKGYVLLGIGMINYNVYSSLIITIIKFVLCILLVNYYGIIGLSFGILISNGIGIIIVHYFFNKGMSKYELSHMPIKL